MPSNTTIHLSYEEKVAMLPKNLRRILIFEKKSVSLRRKSGNIAKNLRKEK